MNKYDFGNIVLNELEYSIYIDYLNKEYRYSKDSRLNVSVFALGLDTLFEGISSLSRNTELYRPILLAFMEVAFWCYNNNIEVYVGEIEASTSKGYSTLYNQYGDTTLEVFNWYLMLDDVFFYALSTDRKTISFNIVSKPRTSEFEHNRVRNKFSGIASLPLPECRTSGTTWKYYKYYVFGSRAYDAHEKYMREMISDSQFLSTPVTPTVDEDDLDSDKAYMDFMSRLDSPQTSISIPCDTDEIIDSSDEVDINTVDFSDFSDVTLPKGVVEVYNVLALVSEETNKPIAIRCKTNFGYYDMNLETARSFGFKVSKINKAIKVTYNNGIYSSASERRRQNFVDDISRNKVDCKRIIDAIMLN